MPILFFIFLVLFLFGFVWSKSVRLTDFVGPTIWSRPTTRELWASFLTKKLCSWSVFLLYFEGKLYSCSFSVWSRCLKAEDGTPPVSHPPFLVLSFSDIFVSSRPVVLSRPVLKTSSVCALISSISSSFGLLPCFLTCYCDQEVRQVDYKFVGP